MKTKSAGFSLRISLIGIVVGCWLLPMALTLAPLAYYTNKSVRRQFDETIRQSISTAAANTRRSMAAAVAASRGASYAGKIREAYVSFTESGSEQALYESVSAYLNRTYRYDDNFLTAMVFLTEQPDNVYYTFNPLLNASYSNVLKYRREVHGGVLSLSESLGTKIAFINDGGSVYMVRNIVDSGYKPYAVIVSELNLDAVLGSFRNIVWETSATVLLNGTAVDAAVGESGGAVSFVEGISLASGEQSVSYKDGVGVVCGREYTDDVDIRYAVEVDLRGFMYGFFHFSGIAVFLLFLTVPLLAFAIWFFYRNIWKPIDRLINAASEIQGGKLGYQLETAIGNREFSYLRDAFNSMSVQLKRQFERIYSEELALRDARIMALQSQINPHFLNNTLEIINWEVRLNNNAKVSKMLESLAIMLDAAMDRKSSPLVPLSQELMYADAYLYIIMERFGKRLTVSRQVNPLLLGHTVPRLIMQPLIENAIEHGVEKRQTGAIEIIAEECEGGMTLGVWNSAPLSREDEALVSKLLSPDFDTGQKSTGSLHLGIHNVNLRLKMIYGERSGLAITSDGESTLASFFVPFEINYRRNV